MGDRRANLAPRRFGNQLRRAFRCVVLFGLILAASCSLPSLAARSQAMEGTHAERVFSITWSPSGEFLASAGFDGTVRVWNVRSRQEVRLFRAPSRWLLFVSWSPRGHRLLRVTNEAIELVDPDAGSVIASVQTRVGAKADPAWSPDGRLLALPTCEGEVRLLDANGRELAAWNGREAEVSSLAWSPDGQLLASGSWDATVRIRDVATGAQTHVVEHSQGAIRIAWGPDGKTLAAFSAVQADVMLLKLETGESRSLRTTDGVTALAWKPDATLLAIGLADGAIELRDPLSDLTRAKIHCGRFIDGLAWSACGRWLAAVGFMESTVCVWDSIAGTETKVRGHRAPVIAVAWSPVTALLASGGHDGKVRLWKPETTDSAPTKPRLRSGP